MARVHEKDEKWMRVALGLARRGLGNVAPNPAVGCILVKDEIVVGRGWTQPGGRPHAETKAIEQAGEDAVGAAAYVTLEPCAHVGQTPPCSEALVNAGISRAVIAVTDPDPRVSGRGIECLKASGISVTMGVLEKEATELNLGFFTRVTKGRPSFAIKTASTLDGKIALSNGDSKWITSERARDFGHLLRAECDGILVGANTVVADDPSLTCRLPGLEAHSPIPIILDSNMRVPRTTQLLKGEAANAATIIITKFGNNIDNHSGRKFEAIEVESPHNLTEVAETLGARGFNSVLIEGGAQVAASFLTANLVDNIYVFSAGKIIGNNGLGSIGNLNLASLPNAPHFTPTGIRKLGPDMLATYRKAE